MVARRRRRSRRDASGQAKTSRPGSAGRRQKQAARRPRRKGVRRAGFCSRYDSRRHGACPGRAPAASRRDNPTIDEAALQRAAKGPIEIIRDGNFLAILGDDETVVEAVAAVAPDHVVWDGVDAIEAVPGGGALAVAAALDRPGDRPACAEPIERRGEPLRGDLHADAHRPRLGRAVLRGSASIARANCRCGRIRKGVYPLRAALARTLKLDPASISVKHVQGPGCYGHNGADDAAADAAVIAMRTQGKPVRVRWRREEEFGFEPVSPAMVVTVRAALDGPRARPTGRPEIWSGRHTNRPGSGGNLLAAEALPDPPPPRPPPSRRSPPGAGTRNGEPLYAFPAKRIVHHLIAETPVRTSSLRGLGATLNVFAIEVAMDELAERAGMDPVAYRLRCCRTRARARSSSMSPR